MSSPPLDSTHGQTMSGVAFHHRLWAAHTVERCLAWHAIIAFGQHKQSNDVRRGIKITILGLHARLDDVGHRMTSPPFNSTRSNDVGPGMTSLPLDGTHGRTTSGVE